MLCKMKNEKISKQKQELDSEEGQHVIGDMLWSTFC